MDHLGNLYLVSSTGQVKKIGPKGDSLAVYNQLRNFGLLTSLDVTNPLKILLFYRDFSTIVILDRFLSAISTVQLKPMGILQPSAIGLSYDNNIWVFDEYDSRLKKINEQGKNLLETAELRNALNESISPQWIRNDNGLVYLADSLHGIYLFDNYGSFKRKLPLIRWNSFLVRGQQLLTGYADHFSLYNLSTSLETSWQKPSFIPYAHSFSTSGFLLGFSPQTLQVFEFAQPTTGAH